jgi:transposase
LSALIRPSLADTAVKELSPRFSRLNAKTRRPPVAPDRLLRTLLPLVLYSSKRQLMEHSQSLLCRWFVGFNMDHPSGTTKNRQRLLDGEVTEAF